MFKKSRGVDLNLLRKTMFWNDIARMVELDSKTHQELVQYIYEAVSDGRINEAEKLGSEISKMTLIPQALGYLTQRIELLKKYKEIKNAK